MLRVYRFHAVYFPAFLLAPGYELPKTILAHAHWTIDRSKMSKGLGNVVDLFQSIGHYGVGGVRHLARLEEANTMPRSQPQGTTVDERDSAIHAMLVELPGKVKKRFENLKVGKALEHMMDCLAEANRHFTQLAPWAPNTPESIKNAYFYSPETLRIAGVLLQPSMPIKSAELLDRMGVGEGERGWEDAGLGNGGGTRAWRDSSLGTRCFLKPREGLKKAEEEQKEMEEGKKEKAPLKVKLDSSRR
ncbi:hypothetical protein BOTBODRAFT_182108 [Botryobasidium botryosum FD-172 SS1]|uniref:Methionyl/Leucyl tRNA synthetase domain-containing protein n=1 Tax=Botryobasidium botryosum (strain FD-172 SS1) TaxID=930990 RepID=A0A067M2W5_BOTB1|nr:hypothetical protein BOTBODRAFT_182108 [Botryobasidium botryosum FD-172 SS1]